MKNKLFFLKLILALVLAFGVVKVVNNEVFIANTPQVRPHLGEYLANRVEFGYQKTASQIVAFLNKGKTDSNQYIYDHLASEPLKYVAPGVYAKQKDNVAVIQYRLNDVEWLEYTFTVHGKQVKINVPKGETPPSQETLDKLY